MPIYTYRREDGTTFDIRQSFSDAPLSVDPQSGQRVQRVIQSAGVIFKGSGYYVTDNRGAGRAAATSAAPTSETKSETTSAAPAPAPAPAAAAND
jgi:putative FmdB family regulatory protein